MEALKWKKMQQLDRLWTMQGDFANNERRFVATALIAIFYSLFVKSFLLAVKLISLP